MLLLILYNIRSLYNVGAIFRVADGAGVSKIYLTGITGYPKKDNDTRKPWEIEKVTKEIDKTALGAQNTVDWEYRDDAEELVSELKSKGINVVSLEQTNSSTSIYDTKITFPTALILGHEREGVSPTLLSKSDQTVHIPMHGSKNNLNVATAAAVACYELRRRFRK